MKKTEETKQEEKFEAYKVHLNRFNKLIKENKEMERLAREAWVNQEGKCILTNKLLKKSKVIFGTYKPKDPEQFDGHDVLPFLVHEDFLKKPKAILEAMVKGFWYDIFEVELPKPDLTPKSLSPEQEAMIAKLKQDHVHDENCGHDH